MAPHLTVDVAPLRLDVICRDLPAIVSARRRSMSFSIAYAISCMSIALPSDIDAKLTHRAVRIQRNTWATLQNA